jgi:AbrB family looped-hinge helix DNA binding protein
MKEILSTLSNKGQVTVPVEVRRSLGLKTGDKIAFVLDNDQVRLIRKGSAVAPTAGMFKQQPTVRRSDPRDSVVVSCPHFSALTPLHTGSYFPIAA